MERKPDTQYVLSLSYGKDSMASIGVVKAMGWPLDRIIHAEVWATDTIQADLPDMVEFKAYADKVILERYGIKVEHFRSKHTYESYFYRERGSGKLKGSIVGFPMIRGTWCNGQLKMEAIKLANKSVPQKSVQWVGIAADEKKRLERLDGITKISPLAMIGWTEEDAYKWCEKNGLLAPTYKHATRGGCWFCHNQSVDQLRILRKQHPELYSMMLKWDLDSPVTFRADKRTLHDMEKRFLLEDARLIKNGFRWNEIERYRF